MLATTLMPSRVFAERQPQVALLLVAAVIVQGIAAASFAAVYGFDLAGHADLDVLLARGRGTADIFRWALLVDMLGYLAVAPVAMYLRLRLRDTASGSEAATWRVDVVSYFGVVFSLVGAIGAVLFAVAGGSLIDAASADPGSRDAARIAFLAVSRGVDEGLWGPLEFVAAGIWLAGTGWLVRGEGRWFASTGIVAGMGMLAYAAYIGLTGRNPVEGHGLLEPLLLGGVLLLPIWELWLAARLWRGR
jgi:hypothetical protein